MMQLLDRVYPPISVETELERAEAIERSQIKRAQEMRQYAHVLEEQARERLEQIIEMRSQLDRGE